MSDGIGDSLRRTYILRLQTVSKLSQEYAELSPDTKPSISDWMTQNTAVGETLELEDWVFPEEDLPDRRQKRAERVTEILDQVGAPFELTSLFRRQS